MSWTTRRSCLRFLAGSGAALATLPTGTGVADPGPTPQLAFVYDDVPASDYDEAFPVHRDEGVPACVGAIVDLVDEPGSGMDPDQLRELQDAGWEIMSHTVDHRALGPIAVTAPVQPGDSRIQVALGLHGEHPGDSIVLGDGTGEEVATVAGVSRDGDRTFLELETPVANALSPGDGAYERLSDEVLRTALGESKRRLEEMGLRVDNVVYPYGRRGRRTQQLAREYYTGVANYDFQGLNPGRGIDPYRVGRTYFGEGEMSRSDVEAFLDEVVAGNHVGMFAAHTWKESVTPERIRFAIRAAKRRDVEIVTLREAFTRQGVGTRTGARASGTAVNATRTPENSTGTPGSTARDDADGGSTNPLEALVDWLADLF